jgi:hypothetical protein
VVIGIFNLIKNLGGFVESNKQIIEKFDPRNENCEEYDIIKNNRAKYLFCCIWFRFGNVQLINGNILLMGGK